MLGCSLRLDAGRLCLAVSRRRGLLAEQVRDSGKEVGQPQKFTVGFGGGYGVALALILTHSMMELLSPYRRLKSSDLSRLQWHRGPSAEEPGYLEHAPPDTFSWSTYGINNAERITRARILLGRQRIENKGHRHGTCPRKVS